ncbi:MAG: hypothetical protein HYX92_05510 [Chloroflexi bacterium]|nr:hypothetical protein [Chloroflexota bacterium]
MITIVTQPFASLGRATARSIGMEDLPILEVPWPFEAKDGDDLVKKIAPLLGKAPEALA